MVATKNLLALAALPVVLANTEEPDAGLRGAPAVAGNPENRQLFWGALAKEAVKSFGKAAPVGAVGGYAADQAMNGGDDDDDDSGGSSGGSGGGGCTIM